MNAMSEYLKVAIDIFPGSPACPATPILLELEVKGDMPYPQGHWQAWVKPWAQGGMEAEPGAKTPGGEQTCPHLG